MTPREQICDEIAKAIDGLETWDDDDPGSPFIGEKVVSLDDVSRVVARIRAAVPKKRPDVGRIVEWSSGAAGRTKSKTGIVAAVVQPGHRTSRTDFPALYRGSGCGFGRDCVSFVVLVNKKVYWPRTVALTWKD